MKITISDTHKNAIFGELAIANQTFNAIYKGDREDRQPIHTVYGGANLFKYNSVKKLGNTALKSLLDYAPNFIEFAVAFQLRGYEALPRDKKGQEKLLKELEKLSDSERKKLPANFSYTIYKKVIAKLQSEAIEDFRIDFEDGFGNRSDKEEDETAVNAAQNVAKGMSENSLSPFIGIRIKPFTEELKERGLRTLDIF